MPQTKSYDSTAGLRRETVTTAAADVYCREHTQHPRNQVNNDSNMQPLRRKFNAQSSGQSSRSPSADVYNTSSEGFAGRQRSMLPEFPCIKNFPFETPVDLPMMETFLVMYKTHCQRIYDSIIRTNFDEVQVLLVHFWQGIPNHLHPLIMTNAFADMVCACDSILYNSIIAFMFSSALQSSIPENLARLLRKFASAFDGWITQCMENMPEHLKVARVDLATKFSNLIKRQLSHCIVGLSPASYQQSGDEYFVPEADSSSYCLYEEYHSYYNESESRTSHHWVPNSGMKRDDGEQHAASTTIPYCAPMSQDQRYSQQAYSF